MNGTSGFQEVRSSTSRSSARRLLQAQRHRFEKGSWRLFRIRDFIALSLSISTKREKLPYITFMHTFSMLSSSAYAQTGRGI